MRGPTLPSMRDGLMRFQLFPLLRKSLRRGTNSYRGGEPRRLWNELMVERGIA